MQEMPILRPFILDLIGFILYPLGSAKIGVKLKNPTPKLKQFWKN